MSGSRFLKNPTVVHRPPSPPLSFSTKIMEDSCFSTLSGLFKRRMSTKVDSLVTMELYIKAGPKDDEIGDCPFAHYVRSIMHYKGLECRVCNVFIQ